MAISGRFMAQLVPPVPFSGRIFLLFFRKGHWPARDKGKGKPCGSAPLPRQSRFRFNRHSPLLPEPAAARR